MVQLAPKMPIIKSTNFSWDCSGNSIISKIIFQFIERTNTIKRLKLAHKLVCNSAFELEAAAFALEPHIYITNRPAFG